MMTNLTNLWYQSGHGTTKTKFKNKTQKKTQTKNSSTIKSKLNPNKTHSKKKYMMNKQDIDLMKYPSNKRKYECKSITRSKKLIKFSKYTKNVCTSKIIKIKTN